MANSASVAAMWSALASARPELVSEGTTYSAWHFCGSESDANELAGLVPAGTKRATAGLLSSYEADGDLADTGRSPKPSSLVVCECFEVVFGDAYPEGE